MQELEEQKKSLAHLKQAHQENASSHEGILSRLNKLEEEIKLKGYVDRPVSLLPWNPSM